MSSVTGMGLIYFLLLFLDPIYSDIWHNEQRDRNGSLFTSICYSWTPYTATLGRMSSVTGMHHYLLPFVIPGPHIQRHWVEWAAWQEWVLFTSFCYSWTPYTATFGIMSSVTGMGHYLLPFVIPGPHIQRHWVEWAAWQEWVTIYFHLLFLDPIYSDIG